MGNFLSIPLLTIAAILEATFLPHIRLFGGGPDLIFLIVLSWAINSKLEGSILWAFIGGILKDLLSASPTGTSVLGLLLVIFSISGIGQRVYKIGPVLLVGLVLIGTLVQQTMVMLILKLTGFSIDPIGTFSYVVAPTMIYNLALIGPTYWFIRRIQKIVISPTSYPIR